MVSPVDVTHWGQALVFRKREEMLSCVKTRFFSGTKQCFTSKQELDIFCDAFWLFSFPCDWLWKSVWLWSLRCDQKVLWTAREKPSTFICFHFGHCPLQGHIPLHLWTAYNKAAIIRSSPTSSVLLVCRKPGVGVVKSVCIWCLQVSSH